MVELLLRLRFSAEFEAIARGFCPNVLREGCGERDRLVEMVDTDVIEDEIDLDRFRNP